MNREEARQKAEALVAQMTVEEACEQLSYQAPAIERLGVPAYNWWNEALHGVARAGAATMYPQAIGLGATFDPALIEQLGDISATEGRAKYNAASAHGDRDIYKGLTFWSPNINIFRDPRWGRGQETFGEDPTLTAEMGKAYVRGLQGSGEHLKSAACAKHFAVHSGPEKLRHEFNATASPKDMAETYLPAFEALVKEAKVESVMGAYNRTNGDPCCANPPLMEKLREWGFAGHFVSDCWAIRDFHTGHHVTENEVQSAALALNTGCDLNCGCTYDNKLVAAVQMGLVAPDTVRRAAVHLFTTRYMLGIMEGGSEFDSIPYTKVECEEHLEKAREAGYKSCVLLKNNGMLPLNADKIKTIGVIGPNADSRRALMGNYHGTASRYITVQEGIQDAFQGRARVLCSVGSHLYLDDSENLSQHKDDRLAEALAVAENSDAVVLVVGMDETMEGEEGDTGNPYGSDDKSSLLLPDPQRRLMDAVLRVGKPTVIILMAGSAIDLAGAGEKADAVVMAWYPGAQGGRVIADLLLGRQSFSGKLPVTFYYNEQLAEMPEFTDYAMTNRTYRYFRGKPLYPFGYGLTYGDVSVTAAAARKTDTGAEVTVTLRNAGAMDTDDVVQIYCQNEGSANAPVHPRLVAFKRVHVPAGGSQQLSLPIAARSLLVVDASGTLVAEGKPVFYVGMGQPDERTRELTGHASLRVEL
ncbi:MAG: glycoside hydrolase family 3 C-terminal domain-containing protein [Clostridia bacterium]|nr:glycoside hydrolase family 3 C-terminal domain-containing protein [Clostridia bacterium]